MKRTLAARTSVSVLSALAIVGLATACASDPPASPASAPLAGEPESADAPTPADSADSAAASLDPPEDAVEAVVSEVIDGDTVIVEFGGARENLRLIGIDTPEPRGGIQPPECYGDEASRYTAELLPEGTPILLTRDVEARDVYDRLLGYIYRQSDGLFINLAIVESGYADSLNIAPNDTFADTFAGARAEAQAADLGLWGVCGGPDVLVVD